MKQTAKGFKANCIAILFLYNFVSTCTRWPGSDPDAVPVDGGLSILAIAGVAYSAKKIKAYRKKKNEELF